MSILTWLFSQVICFLYKCNIEWFSYNELFLFDLLLYWLIYQVIIILCKRE